MSLHLEPRHEAVVREILFRVAPDCEVWAFGSRAHGRGLKPFSDLDLVVMSSGEAASQRCSALRRAFEDSSLPFRVDVVEWASLDETFRDLFRREAARPFTRGVSGRPRIHETVRPAPADVQCAYEALHGRAGAPTACGGVRLRRAR